MAAVWMSAFSSARKANMLKQPADNGTPDDAPASECDKIPGQADGPHKIQKGYGFDDGPYAHKGTTMDTQRPPYFIVPPMDFSQSLENSPKQIGFGQILNKGGNPDPKGALDELIIWSRDTKLNQIQITVHVNKGNFDFETGEVSYIRNMDCPSENLQWFDMNGDLLDDMVCILANGDLAVASTYRISTTCMWIVLI
jgi:hypothetical protein